MSVEPNNVEAALIFLKDSYVGRVKELAYKLGLDRSTVSVFLTKRKAPKKHHKTILKQWRVENGLEKPTESNALSGEAHPIGHIPFEGRDWKMNVPIYADSARTATVMKAAEQLLNAARGGDATRIVDACRCGCVVADPSAIPLTTSSENLSRSAY